MPRQRPQPPADPERPDRIALRRRPAQERSRRRFEAIVDAAALIFAEVGFEAATMEAIAARAETSIGSVYQFFPSKLAVFEALAARCLERSRRLVDALLSSWPRDRPWTDLVDAAIEGLWTHHRSEPGIRAILRNLHLYGTFAEADQALMQEFIGRARELLLAEAPGLTRARATLLATMVVNVISAFLLVCEREDPRLARKLVEETKVMVRRYLEGALAG